MFYFKYSPISKLVRRDDILTLLVQYFYTLPTAAVYKNLNQIEKIKNDFLEFYPQDIRRFEQNPNIRAKFRPIGWYHEISE